MLGPGAEKNPFAEGLVVVDPKPDGPVVGFYADQPIAEAVVDYFGRRFVYAGVAPRSFNGRYDFGALGPGEWIVEPGLVYSYEGRTHVKVSTRLASMAPSRVLISLGVILSGWFH
jgi:hypothetical protein